MSFKPRNLEFHQWLLFSGKCQDVFIHLFLIVLSGSRIPRPPCSHGASALSCCSQSTTWKEVPGVWVRRKDTAPCVDGETSTNSEKGNNTLVRAQFFSCTLKHKKSNKETLIDRVNLAQKIWWLFYCGCASWHNLESNSPLTTKLKKIKRTLNGSLRDTPHVRGAVDEQYFPQWTGTPLVGLQSKPG